MSLVDGLLKQTIDTVSSVAKDGWGNDAKTTVYSNLRCRWSPKKGHVVSPTEDIKEYTVEVWINSSSTIKYDYVITKSSEDYRIVSIEERYNIDGILDHIKLFLI